MINPQILGYCRIKSKKNTICQLLNCKIEINISKKCSVITYGIDNVHPQFHRTTPSREYVYDELSCRYTKYKIITPLPLEAHIHMSLSEYKGVHGWSLGNRMKVDESKTIIKKFFFQYIFCLASYIYSIH